jgi:hypothetical protein
VGQSDRPAAQDPDEAQVALFIRKLPRHISAMINTKSFDTPLVYASATTFSIKPHVKDDKNIILFQFVIGTIDTLVKRSCLW